MDNGDMPIGLAMQLAQDMDAMERFADLDERMKEAVIDFVQSGATGDEAENLIRTAVKGLGENNLDFL